jgi:uroporphyrinogen-III synthase
MAMAMAMKKTPAPDFVRSSIGDLRSGSLERMIDRFRNPQGPSPVPHSPLPRILVTRSEPGASETAQRLRAAGFDAIVEPLFVIVPIDAAVPEFDALAFTSANGARQFARLSPRRDARVFCVGARTAQAAREAGFTEVISADGDVEALIDLIARKLPHGMRLLHVGNAESRGDLAERLSAAGHVARFVPVFHAAPVQSPGPRLAALLAGDAQINAVMVHSPRASTILAGFVDSAGGRALPTIVAISEAAAAPLAGRAARIEIAAAPDEASLISALARLVFV